MKKLIPLIPLLIILFITITNQERITEFFIERVIFPREPNIIEPNNYKLDYNFEYVKQTDSYNAYNKQDILNIIYSQLNNGNKTFHFYCEYEGCTNDVQAIINTNEIIELVNFIHPYNGFRKIYLNINNFNKAELTIEKAYTEDNINSINNKIKEITDKIINDNMTNKEKIIAFHDYIIDNTKYDTEYINSNLNDIDSPTHKAIGPLFFGKGVCSGYTDTMSIFLNQLNIPNYRISSNDHIWNFIKLDNKWYHMDLTWDDPVTETGKDIRIDTFLLITTKELEELNTGYHVINKNIYLEAR